MYSGGGSTTTADAKNAYNVSGPIPISRGSNRVTLSYIETPWNATEDDEGKQRAKSYWYSVAGLLQWGRIRKIKAVYSNGDNVYGEIALTGDTTNVIHNWGDLGIRFRIHPGSETQTADPRLSGVNGGTMTNAGIKFVLNAAPNPHPVYRGIGYVVFDTFCTSWSSGSSAGGTHISDIEFLTYTLNDVINPGGENERYGVNPIGFAYDLFSNARYGLGLAPSRIPLTVWQAKAAEFYTERGNLGYVSPLITSRGDAQNVLADLLSYYHGYMPREAKYIVADWVHYDGADTSALPVLKNTDFLEDPSVTDNDMTETFSVIEVKSKDIDNNLGDVSQQVRSAFGNFLTEESRSISQDMPWFHDLAQARAWAEREILLSTYPRLSVEGPVPRELARKADGSPLGVSSLCIFRDDISGLDYTCRVMQRKDRQDKGIDLKLTEEPGSWAVATSDEGGSVPGEEEINKEEEHIPADIAHIRGWIIPAAMRNGSAIEMAVLVDQPNYATRAEVYISSGYAFAGEEQQLADLTTWTARGALESEMTDSQTSIAFTPGDATSLLSRSFTAAEVSDGYMLVLIGREIVILGTLVSPSVPEITWRPDQDEGIGGVSGCTAALSVNSSGNTVIRITATTTQTIFPYWFEYSRDGGTTWAMAGVRSAPLTGSTYCDVPLVSGLFVARVAEFKADVNKIGAWTTTSAHTFVSDYSDDGIAYIVTRGAYGTDITEHAIGEEVWIFARAGLQRWTHAVLSEDACAINVIPVNSLGAGNPSGPQLVTDSDVTILTEDDSGAILLEDGGTTILTED